jgi:glutathione S-transferase
MGEGRPIVFGARYSVYVWIVRLALEEKGVPYRLVPVVCGRRPTPEYRAEPMAVSAVRENVAG